MKKRIINRAVAFATAVFIALFCFAGCGKKTEKPILEPISEEKRLTVYTSHKEELYSPIIREFEDRYGIWVDVKYGGTTELLSQISEHHDEYTCDVLFGGGIESLNAYGEFFEPYESINVENLRSANLSDKSYWTPFTELPVVIIYNNKLVSKKQAPSSWADLFDEKWRGSIAYADPLSSGSSITILSTILQIMQGSYADTLNAFVEQLDGNYISSSQAVTELVAEGSYAIGITLEENGLKAIDAGKNINIVYPSEGTSVVADGAAIVKGAKHVENAKLFIDFISGTDVQMMITEQMYRRTVRTDIDNKVSEESLIISDFSVDKATSMRKFILTNWTSLTGRGGGVDE